jgi:hypothetical protein
MPWVSLWFFSVAVIYAIVGMLWGMQWPRLATIRCFPPMPI